MDQEQSLDALHLLLQGMVEKDRAKLERSMTRDARLYHMNGLTESREDYVRDILDGTLNYYDYRIKEIQGGVVRVRLFSFEALISKERDHPRREKNRIEKSAVEKIRVVLRIDKKRP